eukprot:1161299-Pelagomonas_calceolata.AAC.3
MGAHRSLPIPSCWRKVGHTPIQWQDTAQGKHSHPDRCWASQCACRQFQGLLSLRGSTHTQEREHSLPGACCASQGASRLFQGIPWNSQPQPAHPSYPVFHSCNAWNSWAFAVYTQQTPQGSEVLRLRKTGIRFTVDAFPEGSMANTCLACSQATDLAFSLFQGMEGLER